MVPNSTRGTVLLVPNNKERQMVLLDDIKLQLPAVTETLGKLRDSL